MFSFENLRLVEERCNWRSLWLQFRSASTPKSSQEGKRTYQYSFKFPKPLSEMGLAELEEYLLELADSLASVYDGNVLISNVGLFECNERLDKVVELLEDTLNGLFCDVYIFINVR